MAAAVRIEAAQRPRRNQISVAAALDGKIEFAMEVGMGKIYRDVEGRTLLVASCRRPRRSPFQRMRAALCRPTR